MDISLLESTKGSESEDSESEDDELNLFANKDNGDDITYDLENLERATDNLKKETF